MSQSTDSRVKNRGRKGFFSRLLKFFSRAKNDDNNDVRARALTSPELGSSTGSQGYRWILTRLANFFSRTKNGSKNRSGASVSSSIAKQQSLKRSKTAPSRLIASSKPPQEDTRSLSRLLSFFSRPKNVSAPLSIHERLLTPILRCLQFIREKSLPRDQAEGKSLIGLCEKLEEFCGLLKQNYLRNPVQIGYDAVVINLTAGERTPAWQRERIQSIKQELGDLLDSFYQSKLNEDGRDARILLELVEGQLVLRYYTKFAEGGEAVIWRGQFQLHFGAKVQLKPCDEIFKCFRSVLGEENVPKQRFQFMRENEKAGIFPQLFGLHTFPNLDGANQEQDLNGYLDAPNNGIRMEYVPGMTAKKFIEELPLESKNAWFTKFLLVQALWSRTQCLYGDTELDLKHNDISPENIMFDLISTLERPDEQEFKVTLIDPAPGQSETVTKWTPGYCPPWGGEQRDAFALAVVTAQILSGQLITKCSDISESKNEDSVIVYQSFGDQTHQIDLSLAVAQARKLEQQNPSSALGLASKFIEIIGCLKAILTANRPDNYAEDIQRLQNLVQACESTMRAHDRTACIVALPQQQTVDRPPEFRNLVNFDNVEGFVFAEFPPELESEASHRRLASLQALGF